MYFGRKVILLSNADTLKLLLLMFVRQFKALSVISTMLKLGVCGVKFRFLNPTVCLIIILSNIVNQLFLMIAP